MKILWLASWYPSQMEPYNGDFVQRHAEAASLCHDVVVFHVIKDVKGGVARDITVDVRQRESLTENIVYYHSKLFNLPFIGKLFSELKYRKVFKKQLRKHLAEHGKPDLVHLHVCMKAGLLALWLKRKYSLPYIVTEHATHFLPEDKHTIYKAPFYYRSACRKVLKGASVVSAVSRHLGNAIHAFCGRECSVIPNVVNTKIFHPHSRNENAVCRFLHISGLGYQKNIKTILAAFARLRNTHSDFIFDVVGPANESLRKQAAKLGLSDVVQFHREMPQPALATLMKTADALVLFSRYETFGCVLIEANACGVPVIVNDIAVMLEVVRDGFNGMIVQNNAEELAAALKMFLEGKTQFNAAAIAKHAEESYGYNTVGEAFSRLYQEVLQKTGAGKF